MWDFNTFLYDLLSSFRDMQWRSWLRQSATSRKVAGSIPDGVIVSFRWHNLSERAMALRSIQPLNRNEYQEYLLRGKGGRCLGTLGWQRYHLLLPMVLKSGNLNLLESSWPVQACNGLALPFTVKLLGLAWYWWINWPILRRFMYS
jgi:hypothetical protein